MGGVLAISAAGSNGVSVNGNSYTVFTDVPLPRGSSDSIVSFCGVNPTSRGSIQANSTDPRDSVVFDSNVLGNDVDVDSGLRCLQALQGVHDELTPVLGLQSLVPGPDGNITRDVVTGGATSFYHFVAGCAVGDVVDGDFKVMGIDGLRVVDASVQPELPPFAGPAATVYMGWVRHLELFLKCRYSSVLAHAELTMCTVSVSGLRCLCGSYPVC